MKLNGRWFPQIVDRDSGNLYPIYSPFPCSDLSQGGVKKFFVISFLIVIGCRLNFVENIFFRKTILSHFMFFLRVLCIIFLPMGS